MAVKVTVHAIISLVKLIVQSEVFELIADNNT